MNSYNTVYGPEADKESLLQLITFKIGQETFGVDILSIKEVNRMMEITRLPRAPGFIKGVINLRGKILPIIDTRKRFHLEPKDPDRHTRIIIIERDDKLVGIIVDEVLEVLRISAGIVDPPPPFVAGIDTTFIRGVGKLDERLLILIDIDKLMSAPEKGGAEK